jgi:hypothetical protein
VAREIIRANIGLSFHDLSDEAAMARSMDKVLS